MVAEASRRNNEAVQAGRLDLRCAEASDLPFADASFNRAFSIHSVYFWSWPVTVLMELHRVLKPGGLLVITMLPKDRWQPNPIGSALEFGTPDCTPYFGFEIEQMMIGAGFSSTRIEVDEASGPGYNASNYSVLGMR